MTHWRYRWWLWGSRTNRLGSQQMSCSCWVININCLLVINEHWLWVTAIFPFLSLSLLATIWCLPIENQYEKKYSPWRTRWLGGWWNSDDSSISLGEVRVDYSNLAIMRRALFGSRSLRHLRKEQKSAGWISEPCPPTSGRASRGRTTAVVVK